MQDIFTISDEIRQQVQFYFQSANLLTDSHLLKEMGKNRSWVPITYFLRCGRVRELFWKLGVELKQRKRRLGRILGDSVVLKVRNGKVKRVNKFRYKLEYQKQIYLELVQYSHTHTINRIKDEVTQFCKDRSIWLSVKNTEQWMFIVPSSKVEQVQNFVRENYEKPGIARILNSQQWQTCQKNYQNLLTQIKTHKKSLSTPTLNLPPNQPLPNE